MWAAILLAEWLAIACAMVAAALWPHPLVWWAAALVVGARQHGLAMLGHLAAHGSIPAWVMWATFTPLGLSHGAFKAQHFAHHRAPGVPGADPEVAIVQRFAGRWQRPRLRDSVLDALGLHADEALALLHLAGTPRSVAAMAIGLAGLLALLGWPVLLWPAGALTGFVLAHRLRARAEHDHIGRPGATFNAEPDLIARLVYLPRHHARHADHHLQPGARVWAP